MPPRDADPFHAADDASVNHSTAETDSAALVPRRVPNGARVTTVRLEAGVWDALEEIAAREGLLVNEVCRRVAAEAGGRRLAEALRVHALRYFREADQHAEPAAGSAPAAPERPNSNQRPRRASQVAKLRGAVPRR